MLKNLIYYRPRIEAALSALDKDRLRLPRIDPRGILRRFDELPVTLTVLPTGAWSSPVADVVMLAKVAMSLAPRHVLEVGSYRGYTARLLAEHTPEACRVTAVDQNPSHGEAYRGAEVERKIERRVGPVSPELFAVDAAGKYELIFLDADHSYDAVKHDTELLLPLLASNGIFVWHDYANWGRFSQRNGVPEYLHELSSKVPVVALAGSWLAAHSPAWSSPVEAARLSAARIAPERPGDNPWSTTELRG